MKKLIDKIKTLFHEKKVEEINNFSHNSFKIGSYSFIVTIIVLAILITTNILVNTLPTTLTKLDMSSSKLYSITSQTKVVLNNLDEDVTIYWICQSGEEDDVIEKLLAKYEDSCEHIEVIRKDPDAYPTFVAQYTDADTENNSLIVECNDRYRYIAYDDIYLVDYSSYYYTGTTDADFDGEGAITSAINYVVNSELPKLAIIEGHGETEFNDDVSSALIKMNYETESVSLLTTSEISDEYDAVVINAPQTDISAEEKEIIINYLNNGGNLVVLSGPNSEASLDNLNSLLMDYDVSINEGIVIEEDNNYYAFNAPYILIPTINEHDITENLISEKYNVIMPIASGLTVSDYASSNLTITELLTTSDTAFSKVAGYTLTTYDKEDDDIDGPFTLAVCIHDDSCDSNIIWVASDYLLDENYNSYSSGANQDFFTSALGFITEKDDSLTIRSKSLNYEYLTISDNEASKLKVMLIAYVPLCFLIIGIVTVIKRRKNK